MHQNLDQREYSPHHLDDSNDDADYESHVLTPIFNSHASQSVRGHFPHSMPPSSLRLSARRIRIKGPMSRPPSTAKTDALSERSSALAARGPSVNPTFLSQGGDDTITSSLETERRDSMSPLSNPWLPPYLLSNLTTLNTRKDHYSVDSYGMTIVRSSSKFDHFLLLMRALRSQTAAHILWRIPSLNFKLL